MRAKLRIGIRNAEMRREVRRVLENVMNMVPAGDRELLSKVPISIGRGPAARCRYDDRTGAFRIELPANFVELPEERKRYMVAHELAHICVDLEDVNAGIPLGHPDIAELDEDDVRLRLQLWGFGIPEEEIEALILEAIEAVERTESGIYKYLAWCGVIRRPKGVLAKMLREGTIEEIDGMFFTSSEVSGSYRG